MAYKTVRCRLIASAEARQAIWTLMAERNTPLVNEVLHRVPGYPDFVRWQQRGKLPNEVVIKLVNGLKTDPRFSNQPVWFYISAQKQVTYTFKSWLSLQRRKQWRLEGKRRWLGILQPDSTLAEQAGCSLEKLQNTAIRILKTVEATDPFKHLFKEYGQAKKALRQNALAYLLKRGAKLDPAIENLDTLAKRYRKAEISIQRLETQLQASLPKGRDLTGHIQTEALIQSIHTPPLDDESYSTWHQSLTREPATFPFPIIYETGKTLVWSRDEQGRLLVSFQGQGTSQHWFKVYCDKPHLHWFERFLADQETKSAGGDRHSAGLFTLRSARLSWIPSKKHQDETEPWNRYHLNLSCTVDTALWTQEGTQLVMAEKAAKTATKLASMQTKESLSKTQQVYVGRLESTIERLPTPYPRPSRPLYQPRSDILVGVSMGPEKPATVAVINAITQEVLVYRSTKQLLGEHYPLLQRARSERVKVVHQGHRQRRKGGKRMSPESDLGKHVDRLLAKAIVELAQAYQAGSIVLPDLAHIREIVEAEVKQRAAEKVPDFVDGQRQYAKAYRTQVHQWSYGRLQDAIASKAGQCRITVETARQGCSGSPQEKAKDLGLLAYEKRLALST
ncbi:type V CRISPR-associated protein Cas12k [Nodosilinea sp. LEGE 07298]|uniref:type V CRISPR-associated protein Cas12k n=1 Tax=Nodosilinea sp. LEGE 07298 TaxID=2777970 RepID=UPI0018823DD0|nr:type V CRISPR-associated protein Cas12k [Nodosilinea sp. LEGE 07298]MBE9107905.1 type V CRISPR-associated protein Cas12k [Nodosilinea sp. LEGE 07298]